MRPAARVTVLVSAAIVAAIPAVVAGGTAQPASTSPKLQVVTANLNNPRKLFLAPDGALYVVEAGVGGKRCLGRGRSRLCLGMTGAITRVLDGKPRRVVTGLWSGARPDRHQAQGPADVVVRGGIYYVLLQNGGINEQGFNALGPVGAVAGNLVSTPPGKAAPAVIVNLAAFEAKRNPDRGAGPGSKYGSPGIDSNPYALVPYRDGWVIVDAGGNDLLWLSPKGAVSVLAVFPTRPARLTGELARALGEPQRRSISMQSVPSSVTLGPDGALYVGELTGWPFTRGTARVWRVEPGRAKTVYASGFTNIVDLQFVGDDLLVLEMAENGLLDERSPGRLIRVAPDGERTVLAREGLVAPTGLAVRGGSIYVSNYGVFPGRGRHPHGQVVRIPLQGVK